MKIVGLVLTVMQLYGSATLAQWRHLDGPHVGDIQSIHSYSDDEIVVFSSWADNSSNSASYRTTNGGKFWTGSQRIGLKRSVVSQDGRILCKTVRNTYVAIRSLDHGVTWNEVDGSHSMGFTGICMDKSGIIYSTSLIYGTRKSTDGGETFNFIRADSGKDYIHSAINCNATALFLSKDDTLFRSYTGGAVWSTITPNTNGSHFTTIFCEDNGTVLAGTLGRGVYRSTDNGANWQHVASLPGKVITTIRRVAKDKYAVLTADDGMFFTSDNCATWKNITRDLVPYEIRSLSSTSSETIYLATAGGILRTRPPYTAFEKIGLPLATVSALTADQTGNLYVPYELGLARSTGPEYTDWIDVGIRTPARVQCGLIFRHPSSTVVVSHRSFGKVSTYSASADSWHPAGFGLYSGFTSHRAIVYDPVTQLLYAGTSEGVFRSMDSGLTWYPFNIGLPGSASTFVSVSGSRFIGVVSGGLYILNVDSSRWDRIPNLSTDNWTAIAEIRPEVLVLGAQNGKVMYSTNAGDSWRLGSSPDSRSILLFEPVDTSVVLAGTTFGLYKSVDSGRSWSPVSNDLQSISVSSLGKLPSGDYLAATLTKGVYRSSENMNRWTKLSGMFSTDSCNSVCTFGDTVLVGTQHGLYRSTDRGTSWVLSPSEPPVRAKPIRIAASTHGVLVAALHDSVLHRSTDQGATWHEIVMTPGLPKVTVLASHSNGALLYQGQGGPFDSVRFFQSLDHGASWEVFGPSLTTFNGRTYELIALDSADNLFASQIRNSDGRLDRYLGGNFQNYSATTTPDQITTLAAIPDAVFAGGDFLGLYRFAADGQSYSSIDAMGNIRVTGLVFDRSGMMYLASSDNTIKAMLSSDTGRSWVRNDAGLPTTNRSDKLLSTGDNLFLSTHERGLWRMKLSGSSVHAQATSAATLDATVFPNPSTDNTKLHLTSSTLQQAVVTIYDELGRIVWTEPVYLLGGAADHTIEARLARGTYYFRVAGSRDVIHGSFIIL